MRAIRTKYDTAKSSYAAGDLAGFSLAEVLAVLVVVSMVLVAVLAVYSRAERAAAAVNRKLDAFQLPSEVLQRIAEDLDRVISPGSEVTMTIPKSKLDDGLRSAKMTILRTIVDRKNKQRTLEEIIWQSGYDFETDTEGMVLYRGHSGIMLEDKLLDDQRADWEKGYPLVPVCSGVTYFRIVVPQGEKLPDKDNWPSGPLPRSIKVTISFAEPVENFLGSYEVPEEQRVTRTMAIDRTRPIRFNIVPIEEGK